MSHFTLRSIVLTLALSGVAQAKESLPSIAVQKAAKQALIQSMQSQIKKHESMTLNEILADVESQVGRNREYLARKKVPAETLAQFDDRAGELLSSVRTSGSPEVVVALERAQLHRFKSSFQTFTVSLHDGLDGLNPWLRWPLSLVGYPLTGALDLIWMSGMSVFKMIQLCLGRL